MVLTREKNSERLFANINQAVPLDQTVVVVAVCYIPVTEISSVAKLATIKKVKGLSIFMSTYKYIIF